MTTTSDQFSRSSSTRPRSVDEEARTVEVVWTTGGDVLRLDWNTGEKFWERLEVSAEAIDLSLLNAGAPLLASHARWGLNGQLGVTERAWVEDGVAAALVRFSKREDVEPHWQDVVDGVLHHASTGYTVLRWEETGERKDGYPVRIAKRWRPAEISMVTVPADAGASTRSAPVAPPNGATPGADDGSARGAVQGDNMADAAEGAPGTGTNEPTEPTNPTPQTRSAPAGQSVPRPSESELMDRGAARERERMASITDETTRAGMPELAAELIRSGATIEQTRARIVDAVAERHASQSVTSVNVGGSREQDFARVAAEALAIRLGVASGDLEAELERDARAYAHRPVMDLCRTMVELGGANTLHMGRREFQRAMMTSDFGAIVADVSERTLRRAYDETPKTFEQVFRPTNARNFKAIERAALSVAPDLQLVAEGDPYPRVTIGDSKESYTVAKYGQEMQLTWEAMINDDLDALERIPQMQGSAAARKESDLVWGVLLGNAAMSDTRAIFNATDGNLSDVVFDAEGLAAARLHLRTRRGKTDAEVDASYLGLGLATVVVGPELEDTAEKLLMPMLDFQSSEREKLVAPGLRNTRLVVEQRITGTNWFALADYRQIDTVEYARMAGLAGPEIFRYSSDNIDDLTYRIRHVYGAGCIDRLGMWKSTGDAAP